MKFSGFLFLSIRGNKTGVPRKNFRNSLQKIQQYRVSFFLSVKITKDTICQTGLKRTPTDPTDPRRTYHHLKGNTGTSERYFRNLIFDIQSFSHSTNDWGSQGGLNPLGGATSERHYPAFFCLLFFHRERKVSSEGVSSRQEPTGREGSSCRLPMATRFRKRTVLPTFSHILLT